MTLENSVNPGSEPIEDLEKKSRRRFTVAEKRRILGAVGTCRGSGKVNALLRREGIYHTYLSNRRRQLEANGGSG